MEKIMKKVLIVFSVFIALLIAVYSYGLDLNPKKKACETACNSAFDDCKKAAEDEYKKDKDKAKKIAKIEACRKAKNDCIKDCGK
jgi:hypothetical protein